MPSLATGTARQAVLDHSQSEYPKCCWQSLQHCREVGEGRSLAVSSLHAAGIVRKPTLKERGDAPKGIASWHKEGLHRQSCHKSLPVQRYASPFIGKPSNNLE